MQGQLRREALSVRIDTECGHCRRPLQIDADGELHVRGVTEAARPLIFVPLVDFARLKDPSIIDAF